ncbi:MAG: exopolysaccharide biosynthesis polyprenyl glycosylphosphotransferase [Bryobacterales bacterium]|nr:exopolysaccharide biosynthesis polyprenyl glycosylphosphotransferase [Bryobacterales bacterium]
MVSHERAQRIAFRVADLACSVIAFSAAYELLLPARSLLLRILPADLAESGVYEALSGNMPGIPELSWIFVVAALAIGLTVDYGNDGRLITIRRYSNIISLQFAATCIAAVAIGTIFYAFSVPLYSRLFVVSQLAWLFVLTAGYRVLLKSIVMHYHAAPNATRRILIAGRPEGIRTFLSVLAGQKSDIPHEIRGCLIDDKDATSPTLDIPVLGDVNSLDDVLIHDPIDEVIIVLPNGDSSWLASALHACDYFRVTVHLVHESLMHVKLADLRAFIGAEPCASIMLMPEEEFSSYRLFFKRLIDVAVSSLALLVLSPLMLLIALAIKISTPKLPVFYQWHVVGYRGRRFTGYKFTTMVRDADQRKETLAALNEMSGPVFKIRNDPRVTSLGRFLRKYSLNELPQLWSVLVGDMSLVGPRPAGPHELVRYEAWHKRKLSVRPGITCYWQVRGRNLISNFDDWVKMDLEYIEKRSLLTDMAILVQTVSVVVRGTGS